VVALPGGVGGVEVEIAAPPTLEQEEASAPAVPRLRNLLHFDADPHHEHKVLSDVSLYRWNDEERLVSEVHQCYEWPVYDVLKVSSDVTQTLPRNGFSDNETPQTPIAEMFGCRTSYEVVSKLCRVVDAERMSTAFSGIDAPGMAAALIGRALVSVSRDIYAGQGGLAIPRPMVKHTHAIEWDAECQAELLSSHVHSPCCCFRNIREFYAGSIQPWACRVEKQCKNSKRGVKGVYEAIVKA
ncbi:unnamed protein product, partial [Prorocentrum cordatum]